MNAKELIELLNKNTLDTWRYTIYALPPKKLLNLRKEMQQGLARLDWRKLVDPFDYSTPENKKRNDAKNKTLNYITHIEHAYKINRQRELKTKNYNNEKIRNIIEVELMQSGY